MPRQERSDSPLWGLLDAMTDRKDKREEEEGRRADEQVGMSDDDYL